MALEKKEKIEEKNKRKIVIPGEKIVEGKNWLPGEGTRRENEEILATRYGLADISDRLVRVIPLSGIYMPRVGNIVIGKIVDVTFNGWIVDINAPYTSFIPLQEVPKYVTGDLTEYFDVGDVVCCKVVGVKRKGVDLSVKGRGLGKLDKGLIIHVNSNKVPRVIGRGGSMINLIKKETNCDITVGQNGEIWIFGEDIKNELLAKDAINFVVSKSYIEGLTDKVKEWFEKQGGK